MAKSSINKPSIRFLNMPVISDWNDGDPDGVHRMFAFSCTSGTNAPTGNPLFGLAFRFDANNIYQLAINYNALWTRKRSFGNWTEWVKIGGGYKKTRTPQALLPRWAA